MYELIADRAFNTPLLVTQSRLDVVCTVLLQRMGLLTAGPQEIEAGIVEQDPRPHMYQVSDTAVYNRDGGYYVDGNVGILNVFGTMIHRGGFLDAMSGITSYDAISRRIDRIGNDSQVKVVLGNFDTPGGEVAGAFDLAEKWRLLSEAKPTHALVSEMAASAGYLIASGSTRIHTTQTGHVGSIGVVMKHIEFSKFNERVGVKPTFIFAGARKIDGNQEQPLPKDVLVRFEDKINKIYSMFVNVVDNNRPINAQAVIDTEAEIYMGEEGVEVGLADAVTTGDELIEQLKQQTTMRRPGVLTTTAEAEGQFMSENNNTQTAEQAVVISIGATSMGADAIVAAINTAIEGADVSVLEPGVLIQGEAIAITPEAALAVQQQAVAEAVTAERERIAAILNSDVAVSRMDTAITLATETDLEADSAIATMAKLPANIKGKSKLDEAMSAIDKPAIGAEDTATDLTDSQKILGAYKSATGRNSRQQA